MNEQPDHFDPADAALDALLSQATWPEPDAASTRRLASFYRSHSATPIHRRRLIAASLLIAGSIAFAVLRSNVKPKEVVVVRPSPPEHVNPPTATSALATVGRPPTDLELARITAAAWESKHPRRAAPAADALETAVAELANSNPDQSMDAAIKLLSTLEPRRREADLARIIFSDDPRRSRAASQLVAATATADSIPLLLQMDRSPATRAAAVPALARLCPPELLATLARSHADPEPRRTLIAGLLATPEGTAQYLNLVLDASTSSDAFAALDRVPSPPTQGFFAALYDPHIGTRLAAARVLGRIDGPETTARLVAMAEQNQSRREALIALADSRGPEAKQFLQEAKRGGPLAGAVRSILIDSSLND